jgi:hypothetical protein
MKLELVGVQIKQADTQRGRRGNNGAYYHAGDDRQGPHRLRRAPLYLATRPGTHCKTAAHQQSGAIKPRDSVDQSGFASGISISMTSASETTATSTAPINTCHQRRTNQPITKLGTKMAGLAKPLISCAKSPKIVMVLRLPATTPNGHCCFSSRPSPRSDHRHGARQMGIRAVFMFLVGAAVGYCALWYYVDLLGLFDYRSGPVVGLFVAAVGAVAIGIVSALFVRGIAIFAAATVVGYFVIVFGWLAYAAVFDIADREGGKGMAMIFIFAPAAGAVIGLIAAGLLARPKVPEASALAVNPPSR